MPCTGRREQRRRRPSVQPWRSGWQSAQRSVKRLTRPRTGPEEEVRMLEKAIDKFPSVHFSFLAVPSFSFVDALAVLAIKVPRETGLQ